MSITLEKTAYREETSTATGRNFTLADLAALPAQVPSGPVTWELWEGELRIVSPPGDFHGSVAARLTTLLVTQGEWVGLGRVTGGDAGVVLEVTDPQTCVGVDVAFLTSDQLPAQHSREGYLLTVPALVVEVRSKKDRTAELQSKVDRYLAAGARVVWVADQATCTVTVHRAGAEPVQLTETDTLTAEDVVPGLAFPVSRLFVGLG